ncbi:DinB family protein [Rhodocytophaga aerolata]|uniref:DinB family protein n=1 Tax=Rhodocytophaga aerolata TaxID=455078 RepID=A0ABT8QZL9_9BACT|nr:DinB family protein [Rhodocytophaga aerolata]MDO1445292.1 DinB family protein [Rhodocytophaga aerolata]
MQQADELLGMIDKSVKAFEQIPPEDWVATPTPEKWSKQEILGHLIDSAINNIRRLVVGQYEPNQKMIYFQDQWVAAQNYQQAPSRELLDLWRLLNLQMVRVMNNVPPEKLQNTVDTGKGTVAFHTLEFIMTDYVAHLKHHVAQIAGK